MHDVLLIISLIIMFLLIPTVKLFSSRVYCLANFLYTCPAILLGLFTQYKTNRSFCLCFLCPLYTIVSCSYPTYLTIFSILGCSCLSCLPTGFSVYLSLVIFQYNVCCFICRIIYPWRMSLMFTAVFTADLFRSACSSPFTNNLLPPLEEPLPACVAADSRVYFYAYQLLW